MLKKCYDTCVSCGSEKRCYLGGKRMKKTKAYKRRKKVLLFFLMLVVIFVIYIYTNKK